MNIHPASGTEMSAVAQVLHRMHSQENVTEGSVGATVERAEGWLKDLAKTRRGVVLVATEAGRFAGCIVVELESIPLPGAMLVGTLHAERDAPHKTALRLMRECLRVGRRHKKRSVWMGAANPKNQTRRTYARMGFQDSGKVLGPARFYVAPLRDAEKALDARLMTRSERLATGGKGNNAQHL